MRLTSYKLLTDFEEHKVFINLRLKSLRVSPEEIKQVTIRIYGILQNYEYLNFLVDQTTKDRKLDPEARRILIMAIYEYLYLDSVPEYAVISEYTKLGKKVHHKSAKFISYYLNNELKNLNELKPTFANGLKNESIMYSHPLWLVKRLSKQYPEEYLDILKANQKVKSITARVIKPLIEPEKYESFMFDDLVKAKESNIVRSEDFKAGNLIIQDLGSYLVGKMVNAKGDQRILDLCAAPGNKTMHIASNAKVVIANEINESRFELLKDNVKSNGFTNIKAINTDASSMEEIEAALNDIEENEKFDKILLDVPCSGWGVFGSKPESKYYQDSSEIEGIVKLQRQILETAINFLAEDGELVYSTCTINKTENIDQVEKFMQDFNFSEVKEAAISDYYLDNKTGITLLPQDYDTDGFYMCKMKRKK